MRIDLVGEADIGELLPLMRGYLDWYGASPSDDAVVAMCHALIADPEREGLQLIARSDDGRAVGFATIFWSWSTLRAARVAVMNDLFVDESARGGGYAEALIRACVDRARARGAVSVEWQTAKDNLRAQAVYDRVGGEREEWIDYSLSAGVSA